MAHGAPYKDYPIAELFAVGKSWEESLAVVRDVTERRLMASSREVVAHPEFDNHHEVAHLHKLGWTCDGVEMTFADYCALVERDAGARGLELAMFFIEKRGKDVYTGEWIKVESGQIQKMATQVDRRLHPLLRPKVAVS
jgi:hypothetical protein